MHNCTANIFSFFYSTVRNGRLAMLAILELLRHDSQNYVSPGFDGFNDLITGFPFLYE